MTFDALEFDFRRSWGVAAITRGGHRHAIRFPHRGMTREQAIEKARPILMEWANSSTSR
jgi:hypothetical protein